MKDKMLDLWLQSLDSDISPEDRALLDEYKASHPGFIHLTKEYDQMRKKLSASHYSFSDNFTLSIMNKIQGTAIRVMENNFSAQVMKVFWRASVLAAAAIVVIILSIYVREGALNMDIITGTDQLSSDNLSAILLYDY